MDLWSASIFEPVWGCYCLYNYHCNKYEVHTYLYSTQKSLRVFLYVNFYFFQKKMLVNQTNFY